MIGYQCVYKDKKTNLVKQGCEIVPSHYTIQDKTMFLDIIVTL